MFAEAIFMYLRNVPCRTGIIKPRKMSLEKGQKRSLMNEIGQLLIDLSRQ